MINYIYECVQSWSQTHRHCACIVSISAASIQVAYRYCPKMALTSAIKCTIYFLAIALERTKREEARPVQEQHFDHLKTVFTKGGADLGDGKRAVQLIDEKGATVFNEEQVSRLRSYVISQTSIATPSSNLTMHIVPHLRNNNLFQNYLTDSLWQKVGGVSMPIESRLLAIAMHCIEVLGSHYSNPKTIELMAQTMVAFAERHAPPVVCYQWYHDLSRNIKKLRQGRKHLFLHLTTYPADVTEFARAHPNQFSPTDPPVPSQVT